MVSNSMEFVGFMTPDHIHLDEGRDLDELVLKLFLTDDIYKCAPISSLALLTHFPSQI